MSNYKFKPDYFDRFLAHKDTIIARYNNFEPIADIIEGTGLRRNCFYQALRCWGVPSRDISHTDPRTSNGARKPKRIHVNETRECACCNKWLPFSKFTKNSKVTDGLSSRCVDCVREFRIKKPVYLKYGLAQEEYDGLFAAQQGLCAVCGHPETLTRLGKLMPLAIDHDHKTGKVRGLLCFSCNLSEGHLKTSENAYALYRYMLSNCNRG